MKSFVLDYVNDVELSIDFDDAGNLFITKGMADVYPCVAAHLDEIHTPCEKEVVIYGDKTLVSTKNLDGYIKFNN